MFLDLTMPCAIPSLAKAYCGGLSQFDALAPETIQIAMQRPEFQRSHGLSFSISALKGVAGFFSQIMHALWWQDYTGFVSDTNRLIAQYISDVEAKLNTAPVGKAQIETTMDTLRAVYQVIVNWAPQFIASEIAKRLIARIARQWADPADVDGISLGIPGNVVIEMNLAVGDLADLARQSPQLSAWFTHLENDSRTWLEQAASMEDSAPFIKAWEDFLVAYGTRGPSEIDITMPALVRRAASLVTGDRQLLRQGSRQSPCPISEAGTGTRSCCAKHPGRGQPRANPFAETVNLCGV